jgi:hypothetical protein
MPAQLKSFMRNSDVYKKKNILHFLAFEKRAVTPNQSKLHWFVLDEFLKTTEPHIFLYYRQNAFQISLSFTFVTYKSFKFLSNRYI